MGNTPPSAAESCSSKSLDAQEANKSEPHCSRSFDLGYPKDFTTRYELVKRIGKGEQGSVFKCRVRATREKYAVKILKKDKIAKESIRFKLLRKEIEVMEALKGCPHAIQLVEVLEDEAQLYIVQERCTGGDFLRQITRRKALSEAAAAEFVKQMLEFVAEIHLRGVTHRDIKPENFMFKLPNEDLLMAVDFGFSDFFSRGQPFMEKMGSPMYVAPEVLWGKGYGPEIDVWGVGVIMYLLLSGRPPFRGKNEQETMFEVMLGDVDFDRPPLYLISVPAQDLLRRLLDKEPETRITASQALSHDWFKGAETPSTPLDYSIISRMEEYADWSQTRKLLLNKLAGKLDEEHVRDLRDQFLLVDTDHDGLITIAELEQAIGQIHSGSSGETVISKEKLESIFARMDMDNNGTVDYTEFIAALVNWQQLNSCYPRALHKCALGMFKSIDLKGNGLVDPEEIKLYAGGGTDLANLAASADKNGDGLVSFPEFWLMLRQQSRARSSITT